MAGNQGNNRIVWTEEMIQFLKNNFHSMTNSQLAESLSLKLTVTRMECYKLGLRRIEMEYWTEEQIQYLVDNYKTKGNQRIANYLNEYHPKKKKWTKNHVIKKMAYLGLVRSDKELMKITSEESFFGGLRFTILKNSSSLNMHPRWIAQQIAWRDKELQDEILKHLDLIELKRSQLLLNRAIKEVK